MRVVTMKTNLTLLTLLAVAVFAVQQRGQAQDDLPAVGTASLAPADDESESTTYSAHVGDLQTYSTFVGDESPDTPIGGTPFAVPYGSAPYGGTADFANFVAGVDDSCGKGCGGKCGGKGCSSGSKSCGNDCNCPMCRHNAITSRAFVGVEFLQWWDKARAIPTLITTDSAGTFINNGGPNFEPIALTNPAAGISPDSRALFGGNNVGGNLQSGGRLTGGLWLDDDRSRALGVRAYGNEGFSLKRNISSDGTQPLGLSFFNTDPVNNFGEDAFIVAHNNFGQDRNGSIDIISQNEFVGGEVFYRSLLDSGCNYRLDALFGYQYARLNDDLLLDATINDVNAGDTFTFTDLFDVSNEYNAGSLGAQAEMYQGCFTLSALGKISLGNMRQTVNIAGTNTRNGLQSDGGFYTQPFTNIGVHTRDVTVWSPEANFKLAYAVTSDLSLSVGYTFIYWNKMALAGDQIDRNVNATQLSGGALNGPGDPTFAFRDTDYWVQTLDIGVNWRY